MPRSRRIYIVQSNILNVPVAAFTVKHEMLDWLERNHARAVRIYVLGDNVDEGVVIRAWSPEVLGESIILRPIHVTETDLWEEA
jgi:hypothetical protein